MDSDWKFERFHDGSFKSAEDNVKKKYEQFLTEFSHHLDIETDVLEGYGSTNIDIFFDPIAIVNDNFESTSYLNLVNSDNKVLNKIVVIFATLINEIELLCKEAFTKFIPALAFFGEGVDKNIDEPIYVPSKMGYFMPTLQNIMCFVNRSNDVIKHTIQQLVSLYLKTTDDAYLSDVSNLYFEEIYRSMSKLFHILITLDELFTSNTSFTNEWESYKRILTTAKHDPSVYGLDKEKIQPFETLLMNLEGKLMQGQIYINCCIQNFDDGKLSSSKNPVFANIFNRALKFRLSYLSSRIDNPIQITNNNNASSLTMNESDERAEFIGWCGLYGLYVTIFGNSDKKLFKDVMNIMHKIPAVALPGNQLWSSLNFVKNSLPYLAKSVDSKQMDAARQRQKQYLQEKSGTNLTRELTNNIYPRIVQWIQRCNHEFRRLTDTLRHPYQRGLLLLEGYQLANRCRILCQTVVQLHIHLNEAITRSTSNSLCRAVEYCKLIEMSIRNNAIYISDFLGIIQTHYADCIMTVVEQIKFQIKSHVDKSFSRRQLDILSALTLSENMLAGAPTKQRITVLKLAMSIVKPEELIRSEDDLVTMKANIYCYDILANYHESMRQACDCTFFYWTRNSVFPCYLESVIKNAEAAGRIQYTLCGMSDCVRSLIATRHTPPDDCSRSVVESHEKFILEILQQKFLQPIARAVESDLRVQFYSHMLNTRAQLNPFTGAGDVVAAEAASATSGGLPSSGPQPAPHANLVHFIKCKPIRFFDRHIRIKDFVEHHLECVFYNLIAIQPSDWRTYNEMRHLAQHRYGGYVNQMDCPINIPDMHLPNQSLEQGRDVLNIMRSMYQFSAVYVYNLNTQVFVEKKSDNKFLNTVNIRHVANSIRTHGWGIINTTVNNAYVFLKDRFYQFSEFLYDERIKGKLIKELHEHKDRCAESNQCFPFQNAERLRTAIRKMFVYDDGSNPLDRFRNHITRMGNAMAFVRSVRSGAMHCGSCSANFLPPEDIEFESDPTRFEQLIRDSGNETNAQLLHAAQNVDKVINNLSRFFVRDTDYFKMFIDVFAPELRSKKNVHCHNFYILLPALTLSFVDYMMECKEKLNRKNKDVFIFSDDGFAIGVAFILKVLDLYKEFDSLQWFKSIYTYYDAKQVELQKSLNTTSKSDENLRQTQMLSLKRLEQRKSEFQLLEYGITSARIFFRADLTGEEEEALAKQRKMMTEQQEAANQ